MPGHGHRRSEDPNVRVSKALSSLLRHRAEKEGFILLPGGYLYLDDILKHRNFNGVTEEQVKMVVESNDKQRFTLQQEEETGRLMIRANQGHSMEVKDLELQPISDPTEFPVVIHGTYEKHFKLIAKEGLKRMGRNHIHFASGEPGHNGVISGMRQTCSIVIYLDLQKALNDGLQFFLSTNNVILSPGNENGVISPAYFSKVKNRKSGKEVPFGKDESSVPSQSSIQSAPEDISVPVNAERIPDDTDKDSGVTAAQSSYSSPQGAQSMTPDELADEMDNLSKKNRRKNKRK